MPPSSAHRPLPGSIRPFKKSTVGRKIFFPTVFLYRKCPFCALNFPGSNFLCGKTLFFAPNRLRHNFRCRKVPILAPNSAGSNILCRKTLFLTPKPHPPQLPVQEGIFFYSALQHFAPGCSLICKTLILRLNLKIIGYG